MHWAQEDSFNKEKLQHSDCSTAEIQNKTNKKRVSGRSLTGLLAEKGVGTSFVTWNWKAEKGSHVTVGGAVLSRKFLFLLCLTSGELFPGFTLYS